MYYISLLLTFVSVTTCTFSNTDKCGYSSCNAGVPNVLNVHIIAHSHDDVGWLKTVDQYYYGFKDSIQSAGVQYILDTAIRALEDNPNRKFSYVEMAFFTRWWQNQNQQIKTLVKKLVNEGRLQFLLGGWSMNDEADTHYTAIIDQMTLGLGFLNETFGECGRPLVAWQIDPFGHSIEQSNLFALMGFDGNIFMRLDYRDKAQRMKELRMEFIQKTTGFSSPKSNSLFTSILYDQYCEPSTFCFDDKCQDPPIMDDPTLQDDNVAQRVNDFVDYVIKQSKAYTTNHILVPMGCDFQFQNAFHNFVNLDKLIRYVNLARKDINVMYSTPACYIHSVNKEQKVYTNKYDDFFPYASGPNAFWTGYFTSRSALKGFVREANNLYQVCKQVQVISSSNDIVLNKKVKYMGTKMGVLQHHDAVSGTEKQEVAYDYAQRLYNGWSACEDVISSGISKLLGKNTKENNFSFCSLTNISYCIPSDNFQYEKPLTMVIYNSLTYSNSHWCRIPVNVASTDEYYVMNSNGKIIPSQLIKITQRTLDIPERPKNLLSNNDLIFNAIIPPMGYSSYIIVRKRPLGVRRMNSAEISTVTQKYNKNFSIRNENLVLFYKNNLLSSILNIKSHVSVNLNQTIQYYFSKQGDGQNSGAYIFRPTTPRPILFNGSVEVVVISGSLVTEVHQTFSEWATLVTRLYKNSTKVESEWTVGPIPINNPKNGSEVIMHYSTDLKTKSSFYTDSNSRQLIKRIINKRYDYNFNQTEPVSGNYYPINSDACIFDMSRSPKVGLFIQTDRALGGGAYQDGQLEIMLHRRTLFDDGYGVGEALNEVGSDGKGLIIRGTQWFTVDTLDSVINRRIENVNRFNKPILLFSQNLHVNTFSALNIEIPKNFYLTSLENHFDIHNNIDYQIVRMENLYEVGKIPMIIDINQIFKLVTIEMIEELNLSANQLLKNTDRLLWASDLHSQKVTFQANNSTLISLLPSEIRTFKIYFKKV